MRQVGENRMAPTVEWDVTTNRVIERRRDYTTRASFEAAGLRLPGDVHTVAEVIEGGLTDVRVACPWDVVRGTTRVAVVGTWLTWAQALDYGVIGGDDE